MRSKKKVKTFDEFYADLAKKNRKEILNEKYKNSLSDARGNSDKELTQIEELKLSTGKYSLRTRIKNNKWVKEGRPASQALKWLYQEVLRDSKTYRYPKLLMEQGQLFTFEYKNPKYKGTSVLPWFDKFPLVLSLGPVVTMKGVRNLGFNLHLVPPPIRIIAICQIFELYKRLYRFQIFQGSQKPVEIKYQYIINSLKRFGLDFAVRMYIPQRQHMIVKFPYRDWYKAIFIPSRGYDGIKANKLIQEWKAHNRKNGNSISPTVDWRTTI